ncbi:WD repeat-containing protein [Rhodotorula diobovata]|uniref:WD repeat-containing protein n=1 Tax=Rhodotorula diobovata TaxID=5288 RepID=A0A5C5FWF3_9BASI|nr:WD repeat-containing protein [Rhodotorula diobovata]
MGVATGADNPFLSLNSLPLFPPHRSLSTSLYPALVNSPAWVTRYDVLQTLGDPGGTGAFGGSYSHRVVRDAPGQTGCVNAMAWEDAGVDARLATGGDDTKICIWSPGLDATLNTDGSNVMSPVPGYGLAETIATGHRGNIFSLKWAPGLSTRLFSCAADAQVRVFDLSLANNPKLNPETVTPPADSPHRPWVHHDEGTATTHVLRCHTDRVKRIATEASSDVFLTCAEDGTVRQHDLRTHHVCRRNRFDESDESSCPPPLASYGPGLSLYSLTVSKLRPHLFVVAGTSPYAYLHDRRMLRAPMQRDWHLPASALSSSSSLTQCVRRFGLPDDPDPHAHIVAAKLSPTRPRDLLVSYSAKGIYLFDTDGETVVRQETGGEKKRKGARGRGRDPEELLSLSDEEVDEARGEAAHEGPAAERRAKRVRDEATTDAAPEASSPATVTPVPPKRVREGVERKEGTSVVGGAGVGTSRRGGATERDEDAEATGSMSGVESGEEEEVADAEESDEEDEWDEDGSEEDEDEDDDLLEVSEGDLAGNPRYHDDVPLVAPLKHYTGHANTQTVKDVNWLTPNLVISGSDDGNTFIWDRETEEIRAIYKGDDDVVNVMQPHPRLPLVAISGIDSTPKLFGPTTDAEAAERANLVRDVERIRRRNASGETDRRSRLGMGGITRDDLLQMLFLRGTAALEEAEDEEEGEGEGEGREAARPPRRRVRVVLREGDDEGEGAPVECVVS